MFGSVIPFCFLPGDIRDDLESAATQHRLEFGVVFVRQGDAKDDRIFLLLKGRVEAFDEVSGVRVAQIEAGHYFGERAALFAEERRVAFRTLEPSEIVSIPGERFLQLFSDSPVFAQSMANILRHKQGVFTNFERFIAELNRALASGVVLLHKLLPLYQDLLPALHPGARQEAIDSSALAYAVRRLPDNVTRCFSYYVTEVLLDHQSSPGQWCRAAAQAAAALLGLAPGAAPRCQAGSHRLVGAGICSSPATGQRNALFFLLRDGGPSRSPVQAR